METTQTRDERKSPRVVVDAYVESAGKFAERIQNISLGGICIQTASTEEVGSTVELVINFPDFSAHVEVQGEVVWVNRTEPKDMGIRYIGLDENRRETLRRFIEKVQSREPEPVEVVAPPRLHSVPLEGDEPAEVSSESDASEGKSEQDPE